MLCKRCCASSVCVGVCLSWLKRTPSVAPYVNQTIADVFDTVIHVTAVVKVQFTERYTATTPAATTTNNSNPRYFLSLFSHVAHFIVI